MDHDEAADAGRLRAAIDKGETRDKVPFPDPAAAPLGTDDEAAGVPPTSLARGLDPAAEIDASDGNAPAVTHEAPRGYDDNGGGFSAFPFVARVVVWLLGIMLVGVVLIFALGGPSVLGN